MGWGEGCENVWGGGGGRVCGRVGWGEGYESVWCGGGGKGCESVWGGDGGVWGETRGWTRGYYLSSDEGTGCAKRVAEVMTHVVS